jgi:hypothetical protein
MLQTVSNEGHTLLFPLGVAASPLSVPLSLSAFPFAAALGFPPCAPFELGDPGAVVAPSFTGDGEAGSCCGADSCLLGVVGAGEKVRCSFPGVCFTEHIFPSARNLHGAQVELSQHCLPSHKPLTDSVKQQLLSTVCEMLMAGQTMLRQVYLTS